MSSLDMVEADAASPRIRLDDKPVSTDSMVTVRLSELHEPKDTLDSEQINSGPPSRASSVMSRSSGRSSTSTEDSLRDRSVDWEELEKTEEQEPKDEDTDEVSAMEALLVFGPFH